MSWLFTDRSLLQVVFHCFLIFELKLADSLQMVVLKEQKMSILGEVIFGMKDCMMGPHCCRLLQTVLNSGGVYV